MVLDKAGIVICDPAWSNVVVALVDFLAEMIHPFGWKAVAEEAKSSELMKRFIMGRNLLQQTVDLMRSIFCRRRFWFSHHKR
jgi:hypothetical protein